MEKVRLGMHLKVFSRMSSIGAIILSWLKFACISRKGWRRDVESNVKEGLRYSGLADPKMKDKDGNVTNFIAYEFHTRVYSELHNFGDSNV